MAPPAMIPSTVTQSRSQGQSSQTHVVVATEAPHTQTTVTIRRDVPTDPTDNRPAASSSHGPEADQADQAARPPQSPHAVRWSNDVVDNEHMNKKKSKKCCIYHKPRTFGDWSDTDSDDDHGGPCDHGCHHDT